MPCYRPLKAWQRESGEVVFGAERSGVRALELACGQCIGCRIRRSRSWAIRCVHEAQMHARPSCFVTLTYDDKHYGPSLEYSDFQKFMKRVRRARGPTRFFACGEYGELTQRRHFHAILFGQWFDQVELARLWPQGFSVVGEATFQSAAYVASYCFKKVNGERAADYYRRVDLCTGEVVSVSPELAHMSLKPGIGASWFAKYWREVYLARDGVVRMGGKVIPPPKYYDRLLDESCPEIFDWRSFTRYVESGKLQADCTPERLAVREEVERARVSQQRRTI